MPRRRANIVGDQVGTDVIFRSVVSLGEDPWFVCDLVPFEPALLSAEAEVCLEFWCETQQRVLVNSGALGPGKLVLEGELTDSTDKS